MDLPFGDSVNPIILGTFHCTVDLNNTIASLCLGDYLVFPSGSNIAQYRFPCSYELMTLQKPEGLNHLDKVPLSKQALFQQYLIS